MSYRLPREGEILAPRLDSIPFSEGGVILALTGVDPYVGPTADRFAVTAWYYAQQHADFKGITLAEVKARWSPAMLGTLPSPWDDADDVTQAAADMADDLTGSEDPTPFPPVGP